MINDQQTMMNAQGGAAMIYIERCSLNTEYFFNYLASCYESI